MSSQFEWDLLYDDWSNMYEAVNDPMDGLLARASVCHLNFLEPYQQDPLVALSSKTANHTSASPQTEDDFFLEYPELIENNSIPDDGMDMDSGNVVDVHRRFSYSSDTASTAASQHAHIHSIKEKKNSITQKPNGTPTNRSNVNPYSKASGGSTNIAQHQPPISQPPLRPQEFQSNNEYSRQQKVLRCQTAQSDQCSSQRPPETAIYPRPVSNAQASTNHQFGNEWDAFHAHQRNPFQTAKEYQQQISEPRPLQPRHVPQQEPESPQQQPPPIPDSLKRKFKAPKVQSHPAKRNPAAKPTKRHLSSTNENKGEEEGDDEDDLPEELKRFGKDLVEAIENEIIDNGEKISFREIAGLADQKGIVQEVVCWPLKRPDLFTGLRRAPNGLLLYGPPGTGKTLIGKAIATEAEATFFSISSSSITSKWMGQGEKLVRTLFAVAAYREPSVVFIDEIDSLLTARKADENEASRRIKTEFLVQLDGVASKARVLVIGATNRPGELDEAARRRFTKRLYIPLPSTGDREQLLRELLSKSKHKLKDEDIVKLSRDTAGFSGADLKSLSVDAAMGPLRELGQSALEQIKEEELPPISLKHFKRSLRGMSPSVAPNDLVHYEEWDKLYGTKRSDDDDEMSDSDDED